VAGVPTNLDRVLRNEKDFSVCEVYLDLSVQPLVSEQPLTDPSSQNLHFIAPLRDNIIFPKVGALGNLCLNAKNNPRGATLFCLRDFCHFFSPFLYLHYRRLMGYDSGSLAAVKAAASQSVTVFSFDVAEPSRRRIWQHFGLVHLLVRL
jgi:hypothetical protein